MLPRTVWVDELSSNARNWPHKIEMKRGIKKPKAVWSQEFFEARFKLLILAAAVGAAALAPIDVAFLLLGVLLAISVYLSPVTRWMETVGHEIEVQAAVQFYRVDEDRYRTKEAGDLTAYDQFAEWSAFRIEAGMKKWSGFARAFVKLYRNKIVKNGTE